MIIRLFMFYGYKPALQARLARGDRLSRDRVDQEIVPQYIRGGTCYIKGG